MISLYSIALFLHVAGALALFAALALEWLGLAGLRRATVAEQVREWARIWQVLPRLGGPAMGTLLVSGIYMAVVTQGQNMWWVGLGLLGMVAMGALGARNTLGLATILSETTARGGPLPTDIRGQLTNTRWWAAIRLRVMLGLGVVFLMTVKPGLVGSLITMGVAVVLGLAWARSGGKPVEHRTAAVSV
jgi:hypothetical protein